MGVHRSQKHEVPWRDEEKIRRLYCDEKLTMQEIADRFDVGIDAIHRSIEDFGIESRSHNEGGRKSSGWVERVTYYTKSDGYEVAQDGYAKKSIKLHRLVAVAEFGIEAVTHNLVHHKNGITWDNRPENLEVMSRPEHCKHHYDTGDFKINNNPNVE